jgi:uncharacterized protein YdaU (DUF1376 family)
MASPYMPLYIADYMADCAHLETLEHGAYLLLIMNYWQRGKPLPNDDAKLSKIVNLRIDKWKKIKNIISEFFIVNETEWTHARIEEELSIFREKSEKARLAGQKSGEKRRDKKGTNVQQPLNECLTSVEQTLNHTDTDTDTYKETQKEKAQALPASEHSLDANDSASDPADEKLKKQNACPYDDIIALYHKLCPLNTVMRERTKTRDDHLRARWREYPDLAWWEQFFDIVAESKFLTGRVSTPGRRPFVADLPWLTKPENFVKVLEGKYDG